MVTREVQDNCPADFFVFIFIFVWMYCMHVCTCMDVLVSACMSMYKHVGEGAEVAIGMGGI